jgi:hypothetical protein
LREQGVPPKTDTPIGQLICMVLRNRSDQKGCPQPALQSLESQSRFSALWLVKKEKALYFRRFMRLYYCYQFPTAHSRPFTTAGSW